MSEFRLSDSARKQFIRQINNKLPQHAFSVCGYIFTILGVILTIVIREPIKLIGTINGVPDTAVVPGIVIGAFITLFGAIMLLVGKVFYPKIRENLYKGEICYPVAETKVSKEELLQEVLSLNNDADLRATVEVFDDWIDFTIVWMNCIAPGTGVSRYKNIYKKMILVDDDYTYQELDMDMREDYGAMLGKSNAERHTNYGKLRIKSVAYQFGEDLNENNLGINKFQLDTVEITNKINKWLADRGYTRKM